MEDVESILEFISDVFDTRQVGTDCMLFLDVQFELDVAWDCGGYSELFGSEHN